MLVLASAVVDDGDGTILVGIVASVDESDEVVIRSVPRWKDLRCFRYGSR